MIKTIIALGTSLLSGLGSIPVALACENGAEEGAHAAGEVAHAAGECAGHAAGQAAAGATTAGFVAGAIAIPALVGLALYLRYRKRA
jgi:hypothetical protein